MLRNNYIFDLVDVRTAEFHIDGFPPPKVITNTKFGMYLPSSIKNGLLGIVEYEITDKSKCIFLINIECTFIFDNPSWELIYNKDRNSVGIPKYLTNQLSRVTIDAARGIMKAKTEGTNFKDYLIPHRDEPSDGYFDFYLN